MLKKYPILTLFFWSLSLVVNAQIVNIPDANFKNALVNTLCVDMTGDGVGDVDADTNNDGEIQESETLAVLSLNVSQRSIQSLTGIEQFGQLEYLDCKINQLTTLNLEGLTNLGSLSCDINQLTALNLEGLTNLGSLSCDINQLTTLNLEGLTNLTGLSCGGNQLTALNLEGLTNLTGLSCGGNQLTTLNLQGLTNLQELNYANNQLTTLDLQELSNLTRLNCTGNQLTTVNLQGLTNLTRLDCSYNQLTTLDAQGLIKLKELNCYHNQLTTLNLQGLTNLTRLDCSYNQLTTLDAQGLIKLKELNCYYNQLTTLNLQGLTMFRWLHCWNNQLTTLDVELTNLYHLHCSNNQLTTLDVQGMTSLSGFTCSNNQLTTLDVQGLTNLDMLYCENNQLTTLDVQGLTNLRDFRCGANQLTTLDVQGLTNLDSLYCQDNQLTTLYIKNGHIEPNLDFENNPLVYICCDEGQLSYVHDQATQNGLTNCVINNSCYQAHAQGQFTQDLNLNCQTETPETGLAGKIIKAKRSGVDPFYAITNDSGYYDLGFDPGLYRLSVLPYNSYYELCDDVIWVNLPQWSDTANVDFLVKPVISCPLLEVNISSSDIRHCIENQYIVRYCNTGPAPAPNAQVTVTLSDDVQFISSTIPGVNTGGHDWQFSLGEVGSEACGSFAINFLTICDLTVVGQSICATAHITPDNICTLPNSTWSGAEVMLNGSCEGDSVRLVIRNTGTGNMTANQKFRIIEDKLIFREGIFNLTAQDSLVIKVPANGSTYRLESAQESSFPFSSWPSVTVEGCGLNSAGSFSLGFVSQFNIEDANPFYSQDCREISIGSFDLNDKSAQPIGVGDAHYIEPKTPIDYQIRFQNTGNDTVSTVVIRDTLSAWLDPESFKLGISDHAFRVDFEGPNILKFTFDQILLPNSNVNEPASHGFVQFQITPKPLTPLGTKIENQTAIFFDFNAPVITNLVFHTVDTGFLDRKMVSVFSEYTYAQQQIYPNPIRAGDLLFFENLPSANSRISLVSSLGKVVFATELVGHTVRIPSGLAGGVYFLEWTGKNGVKRWGKVVVR